MHSGTFAGTDLRQVEELLSTSYAPTRIISADDRPRLRLTRAAAGGVSVDQLELTADLAYEVEPVGRLFLCDVESGGFDDHLVHGWRKSEAFGPGDLFSFAPPVEPASGRLRHVRATVTLLAPVHFSRLLGAGREVRLLSHRPVDTAAGARLRAAIHHVRDTVLAAPDVEDTPLVVSTACGYLVASVLRAFPSTAHAAPTPKDGGDAHVRTLQRAMAFIESNADKDISAADIAAAAHVTVRAVQLSFRRHAGTTPMEYLRRVRLDGARADLHAADPHDVTVTGIGARWGFGSGSTFAAHYRAAYGESPVETLRADGPPVRVWVDSRPRVPAEDVADVQADHFEELTRRLLRTSTVAEALRQVADAAKLVVSGADMVSVTVRAPDGTFHTPVRTGTAAGDLDQVQYRAGRGPCVDAARSDGPGYVASDDLGAETRWPEFAGAAVDHGFHAILSCELFPAQGRQRLSGALNVYSRHVNGLDHADRHAALLLATHGSLALAHARAAELADLRQAQFRRAVGSRDVIGQAKGILMHRQGITADEAFDLLRRTSQQLNVKLLDLAGTLTTRHAELDER
ncbi:ANTAR domain-containing protein [Lentzea sp.]|uniref:ANTAR domain-containing protein n=1 Tax=Lentzea sp. TaxID=56099 RepID=UPI002ED3836A